MRAEQWIQDLVHQCHITQEYTSLPCKPVFSRWAIFQSPTECMQFYCISDGWCVLGQTLGALYGQHTLSGLSEQHRNCIFVQIYGLEIPVWWWPRQVTTEKIIPKKISTIIKRLRWRSTYAPSKFLLSWIYSRYFVIFENVIGLLTTMLSVTVCSHMLYIKCFLFMRF